MANADFTPTKGAYTELKPFRFWCQKVLPLVYDDSLSYYELLCKVVDYLNKTMEDVDTLNSDVTNLFTAYDQLQDWVNAYYESADFEAAIDAGLDRMAESGQLTALINAIIAPQLPDIVDLLLPETVTTLLPDEVANQIGGTVQTQLPGVVSNQIGPTVQTQLPGVVSNQIGGTVANQLPAVVSDQINDVVAEEIVDPVEDWLESNVSGGNAVDRTLSILGAGADAAFTGARLDTLDNVVGYEHVADTGFIITTANPYAFNSEIINDLADFSDLGTHTYKMIVIPVNTGDKYCINAHKISIANVSTNHFAVTYAFCAKYIGDPQTDEPRYLPTTYSTDNAVNMIVTAPEIVIPTGQGYDETTGYLVVITADIQDPMYKVTDSVARESEITSLRDDLDELYIPSQNLYNPATDRHGKTIDSSGNITDDATYKLTDYIEIAEGNKVSVTGGAQTGALTISFYTDNTDASFTRRLYLTTNPQTFTLGNREKYIVLSMYETVPPFMVNIGETLLPYVPYGGATGNFLQPIVTNLENADAALNTRIETIEHSYVEKDVINRFNKATIIEGKYINVNTGGLSSNDAFFASDYIYIGDLSSVTVSYTHLFGWYDTNKAWLGHPESMNSSSNDITIAVPENAVYLRFSAYNTNIDAAQIGESVSRGNYVEYGKYTLPGFIPQSNVIIVDASGNGDYNSLTEALYDHVNDGIDIEVKPGTYNIVSEYVSLFGQEAVDSMADADSAIFNGFQYGAIIRNRTITFDSGSYVVCDWTGHTVDGTHRFSALRVDYNCKIIGLHLVSTATFYAIHDDYGLSVPYTVEYENCYVEGVNLTNANCIGGGCKKYSRHIIKNCYFDNHLTNSATVRYHNTNTEGAVPEIYVSNCYFNNWFTPRWYGTQTSKMKVYVNNCEARAIYKMAESSSFNVDNVDLYKWCNTETNPVT